MRGLIKRLSIIISVLVVILGLSSCSNNKESIQTPVRNVNIVDTSMSLDSIFYSYNIETNDNVTTLEAQKLITREDFDNINNLSEVSVRNNNFIDFDIVYDADANIISITASMDNELGYLEAETIYGVAFTNEDGNIDAALDCDGEMILLSDLGSVSSIEECKWFKKICKTVKSVAKDVVETVVDVAVDTAAIVVAAAPAIVTAVVVTAVVVAAAPEIIILGEVAVAGASVGLATGLAAGAMAAVTSIYSGYTEAVFEYANGIKDKIHEDIDDLFDANSTNEKESNEETDSTNDENATSDDSQTPDDDQKTIDESSADHIFRDAEGHLKDDTPENRKKLEGVANDNNNFLGTDQYGNDWYAKDNSDGTQTWVEVRGNKIRNGGVNLTPKPWNPLTGLSGQN